MLKQLRVKTGLLCNAHTFRRTFASLLAKIGIDSLEYYEVGEMGVYSDGGKVYAEC